MADVGLLGLWMGREATEGVKEEGWRLEKALLGWGHHLGYRVWAQARVGTQRESRLWTLPW